MIPVARYVLWENTGTTPFTMVQGTVQWWQPGSGSLKAGTYVPVGTFVSNNSLLSTSWFEIPAQGSDHLVLQYQSRLIDVSNISGNVTTDVVSLALQGLPFVEDGTLNKPHTVQQASLTPNGNHGNPDFASFAMTTTVYSDGNTGSPGQFNMTSYGGTDHGRNGMFVMGNSAARAPVSGTDYPGWAVGVSNRSGHNTTTIGGGTSGGFSPLPRHCMQTIWVAASHFASWSAPGGNVAVTIQGRLVALLYRRSPGSLN